MEDPTCITDDEKNLYQASANALAHLTIILKENILEPVINFAFPKLQSENWVERLIGNLALQAVIEGPNEVNLAQVLNDYFKPLIAFLNEPVPKVKKAVAYVMFKFSINSPYIIISNQEHIDLFITTCL